MEKIWGWPLFLSFLWQCSKFRIESVFLPKGDNHRKIRHQEKCKTYKEQKIILKKQQREKELFDPLS